MRQVSLILVVILLVALGAALRRPRPAPMASGAGADPVRSAGVVRVDSLRAARSAVLRQIADADTYIPAMLAESDSLLRRWPDRQGEPLAVFLPESDVAGYTAAHGQATREAFARWERVADIPVTFRFTRDSARADVIVRWIPEFPMQRTGQADVRWNGAGWLLSGTLTLATANHGGVPVPPEAVHTVALHEIGHLLGLGHSDDPADVMYPTTDVHDITVRDRSTARLLYALPPGSLRGS